MTLQARPTTYQGISMRSRLEATFAASMDRWGYDWRYEPRAFASPRGQYLPDFELWVAGTLRAVVELKGGMVDDIDAVFERMRVVWESDPNPFLVLIEAEALRTRGTFGKSAPRAAFLIGWQALHDAGHAPVPGVFTLCPCGTVGIRIYGSDMLLLSCRSCGAEGSGVAYLDPTEYRA